MIKRAVLISFALVGVTSAAIAGVMLASGAVGGDIRSEFLKNTAGGIEVGYLCQARGWDETQCKADFLKFMDDKKKARQP